MSGDTHRRADHDADAIRWIVRMHSDQVTLEDEHGFSAWLAESDAHGEAYRRLGGLWTDVGEMRDDPARLAALAELRRSDAPTFDRRRVIAASLAGGLGLTGAGWIGWRALFGPETIETALGEQRRVTLADGSEVTLNTNTALRVAIGDKERRIWLDQGQAFFSVSHDPARPFRVFVGDDEVRALGTAFEVRREGASARVTLEEGSVAVFRETGTRILAADAPARPVAILRPGQQAVVSEAPDVQVAAVDTRSTGAWRFGRMVLESEPLSEAVAEINRYNARQIIISDPSLRDLRVNGVFQTGRPEAFVDALTLGFPVTVASEDDRAIYLRRSDGPGM